MCLPWEALQPCQQQISEGSRGQSPEQAIHVHVVSIEGQPLAMERVKRVKAVFTAHEK